MKISLLFCKISSIVLISQLYKVTCIDDSFNSIYNNNVVNSNGEDQLIVVDIDILENTHEIQYIYDKSSETHILVSIPPRLFSAIMRSGVKKWSASNNRYPDALYIKFDSSGEPVVRAHYPNSHISQPSTAPPERESSPPIPTTHPDSLHKSQELVPEQCHKPQSKRIVLTESKLIILNINNMRSTNKIIYEKEDDITHYFIAIEPYFFKAVVRGRETIWSSNNDEYPVEVMYKTPPGVKPLLELFYPPEDEKPIIPPKPSPQELEKRQNVDINNKYSTDKIDFRIHKDGFDIFTPVPPSVIDKVSVGPSVAWRSRDAVYPDEVVSFLDENGKPYIQVICPIGPSKSPHPKSPERASPPKSPQLSETRYTSTNEPVLITLDLQVRQDTNEYTYKIDPKTGRMKFTCRPGYLVSKVVKSSYIVSECTDDNYFDRVVIYRDKNNERKVRALFPGEIDYDDPDEIPSQVEPIQEPEKSHITKPAEPEIIEPKEPSEIDLVEPASEFFIDKPEPELIKFDYKSVDICEPNREYVTDKSSQSLSQSFQGLSDFEDIEPTYSNEPSPELFLVEPFSNSKFITIDVKVKESTEDIDYHYDPLTKTHTFTPKHSHIINVVNRGRTNIYTHETGDYPEKVVVYPGPDGRPEVNIDFPEDRSESASEQLSYESVPIEPFDPYIPFDLPNHFYYIQESLGDFEYLFKPEGKCTRVTFDGIEVWKKGDYEIEDPTGVRCNKTENQIFVRDRNKIIIYLKDNDGKWNYYITVNIKSDVRSDKFVKSGIKYGNLIKPITYSEYLKKKGMDFRSGVKLDQSGDELMSECNSGDSKCESEYRVNCKFKPRGFRVR